MYKVNFKQPIHVHFIGIGGISMSGLAEVLLEEGFRISGSDVKKSNLTEKLAAMGGAVFYGHRASNITDNIDLIVYTAAIHADNPELQAAIQKKIPLLTRAELLGQIMTNYKTSIAVSGTHGKTTTTSMISQILLEAGADPTISVGGVLKSIEGNIRVGKSDIFITEACEYTNSFLEFFPKISLILNIEEDHLDFFKDIDDIRNSFRLFAEKLPDDGILIINGDIPDYKDMVKNLACKVITYGSELSNHYSAKNIDFDHLARGTFDLVKDNQVIDTIHLNVTGLHNIYNALASMALSLELSIPLPVIKKGLLAFSGTDRRFEYKGAIGGVTVIDDYAHHPTEIAATLTAAKNYPHKTTWCVFQPHTYTRTKAFLKDFAKSLTLADEIILLDIYAARETNTSGITSLDLKKELEDLNINVHYFPSFDETENFLLTNCTQGDLVITMGAGDVFQIGERILGN